MESQDPRLASAPLQQGHPEQGVQPHVPAPHEALQGEDTPSSKGYS